MLYILIFGLLIFAKDVNALDDEYDESILGGITKQRQAAIYFTTARRKHSKFDFQGAIEYYSKILELYPDTYIVYVHRGNAKSALRDYKNAIDDYTSAIALYDDNHIAFYERGRTRISAGLKDEGCVDLTKAKHLGNTDANRFIRQFCG